METESERTETLHFIAERASVVHWEVAADRWRRRRKGVDPDHMEQKAV